MTEDAPNLYRVLYSKLVQAVLAEFTARAAEAGRRDSFLHSVKELDRLLGLYPQFGEPETDLKNEPGQVYNGTVPPLVVRYAVFEDRRLVFVGSPPRLLPNAGF